MDMKNKDGYIEFLTSEGLLDKHEVNRDSDEQLNQMKKLLKDYELVDAVNIYEMPESITVRLKEQITFAKSLSLATIEQSQMMMIHRPDQLLAMQHRSFPLYYFLGQNDPSVTMEMAQLEIDKLPGALAHVEEGIGHMGHWESTRHVAQFINRVLFSAFDEQDV
jgi:pimeloyl-ACP methyl ester carboxylesterase